MSELKEKVQLLLTGDILRVFSEGGINWCWFTELTEHLDGTVTILQHYRLHRSRHIDQFPKDYTCNTQWYGVLIWKGSRVSGRETATHYNWGEGWKEIRNIME